jgi:hypothetical protein
VGRREEKEEEATDAQEAHVPPTGLFLQYWDPIASIE